MVKTGKEGTKPVIKDIVQDLLNPTTESLRYTSLDAVALIKDICERARWLMRHKEIHLQFESDIAFYEMAMDKHVWEKIVLRLLSYAKDCSYQGGKIHCLFQVENEEVVLSVRDYGENMPNNSGMGLHDVKELTELMGGEVRLVNANPGTTVVVRTPVFFAEYIQEAMPVDDYFAIQMELPNF